MKKKLVSLVLSLCFLFITSCDYTPNNSSGEEIAITREEVSSSELEIEEEGSKEAIVVPEVQVAGTWDTLSDIYSEAKNDYDFIVVNSIDGETGLTEDGTFPSYKPNDFVVEKGEIQDSTFLRMCFKYSDTTIMLIKVSTEDGEPYYPSDKENKKEELVKEFSDLDGFLSLELPTPVKYTETGEPIYGYTYYLLLSANNGKSLGCYYPVPLGMDSHNNSKVSSWHQFGDMEVPGNPIIEEAVAEEQENLQIVNEETEEKTELFDFPSYNATPALKKINTEDSPDNYYPIVFSNFYLKAPKITANTNSSQYSLVELNTTVSPVEETTIAELSFLFDEIKNTKDSTSSLLFARVGSIYNNQQDEEKQELLNKHGILEYIVLYKKGNEFAGWFTTSAIDGKPNVDYDNFITTVVAAPRTTDISVFLAPQLYECDFFAQKGVVDVYFPTTFSKFSFNFNNFSVKHTTHYDSTITKLDSSSFVDASSDNRYQIWKINERWVHEGSTFSYALYDSVTETVNDFNALNKPSLRLSFVNDNQLALIEYKVKTPYDNSITMKYNDWMKENVTQPLFLYNLQTKETYPLKITLGDLNWNHNIWGYLVDSYTGHQLILSTNTNQTEISDFFYIRGLEEKKNSDLSSGMYIISHYDSYGNYLGSDQTEIYQFGGKFVYYPAIFSSFGNGRLLLKSAFDDYYNVIDASTGKSINELDINIEQTRIDEYISWLEKDGTTKNQDIKVSMTPYLVNNLPNKDNGVEIFSYFIDELKKMEKRSGTLVNELIDFKEITFYVTNGYIYYVKDNKLIEVSNNMGLSKALNNKMKLCKWSPDDKEYFVMMPTVGRIELIYWNAEKEKIENVHADEISTIAPWAASLISSENEFVRYSTERFGTVKGTLVNNQLVLLYKNNEEEVWKSFLRAFKYNDYFYLLPYDEIVLTEILEE